jgi:hypothetical protein
MSPGFTLGFEFKPCRALKGLEFRGCSSNIFRLTHCRERPPLTRPYRAIFERKLPRVNPLGKPWAKLSCPFGAQISSHLTLMGSTLGFSVARRVKNPTAPQRSSALLAQAGVR